MRAGLFSSLVAAALLPEFALADMATANRRAKAGDFDATAQVACAQEVGQALGTCDAAAARAGGFATVVVTFANGFSRNLMFEGDAFLRGNATMSGVGTDTDWRLSAGVHRIRVDDQRFEIPETLVAGD